MNCYLAFIRVRSATERLQDLHSPRLLPALLPVHCAFERLAIASRGLPWKQAALRFLLVVNVFHRIRLLAVNHARLRPLKSTSALLLKSLCSCFFFLINLFFLHQIICKQWLCNFSYFYIYASRTCTPIHTHGVVFALSPSLSSTLLTARMCPW